MKIRVAVSKDGKIIASEIVVDPKPGDISAAGHRVFDQARSVMEGDLWDCNLSAREVQDG